MKKILFTAIPLLLLSFSSPRKIADDVTKKNASVTYFCLKTCSNPLHPNDYEVRIPSPPGGTTYLHVDGILIGSVGRIVFIPKTASVFTFSTLVGGNYAIYDGGNVSDLAASCGGSGPVPNCP